MPRSDSRGRRRPWRPSWASEAFVRLWAGQSASVLGSEATRLAFPLLALAVTGSPTAAGVVGFAAGLPSVVVQLPAGALVDRFDRRHVMIACDVGRLLVVATVPLAGLTIGLSVAQLAGTAFVLASLTVVFVLAERAAVPYVVDAAALPRAVAVNQSRIQAATVAGQPLGGALFGVGAAWPFVFDAVSYVVSLVSLRGLRVPMREPAPRPASVRTSIAEGIRYVWRDRTLRALAVLSAGLSFVLGGLPLLSIVRLGDLGAGPAQTGVVLGLAGLGGLAGAAAAPWAVRTVRAGPLNVAALWVWVGVIALVGVVTGPWVVLPLLAVSAALGPVLAVIAQTRRAWSVPRHLIGRVYSVTLLIAGSTIPLGSLVTGVLLSTLGSRVTGLVMGAVMLVVAAAGTASARIRSADLPSAPP